MMRSNAPITVILALAAACFFPANGVAKPTHPAAHKTRTAAPTPTHRKQAAAPARNAHKHAAVATSRVHTEHASPHRRTRHAVNSTAPARAELTASASRYE